MLASLLTSLGLAYVGFVSLLFLLQYRPAYCPEINREIKRRTRVASIFPNSASCLCLVSALLAECDEDWMSAKIYLTMNA